MMEACTTITGLAMLLLLATFAQAQMVPDNVGKSSNGLPPALVNVDFDPQLNAQIPLNTEFVDETGRPVELGEYFGKEAGGASVRVLHLPDAVRPGGAGGGGHAEDDFV